MDGKNLSEESIRSLHDGMFVITLMYGCEAILRIGPDR